jgi:hypothetical protein
MNKYLQFFIFIIILIVLLLLTFIGDVSAIASSGNYYVSRGVAVACTIFTIWFLFFVKKRLKLPTYIFYFFLILNGFGLCYASSMLIASFFI